MKFVRKAYGYITRIQNAAPQVLVFRHPLLSIATGGIQIPKGTVQANETPLAAVKREVIEETGLTNFTVEREIAVDQWEGLHEGVHELHERHFFLLKVRNAPDAWDHRVTGDGGDADMVFHYFWINSPTEVEIAPNHGDYLHEVFL